MDIKVRNIIIKLREIKEQRGLSCQDIYEMSLPYCDDNQGISLTTVREMFGDNWMVRAFKYKTVKPISMAMLGPDDQELESAIDATFDSEKSKEYFLKWQASQELIDYLRERMAEVEEHCEREKAELSLLHDKNIDRLLSQHQKQDEYQSKIIDILEKNNTFLQQTVDVLRASLSEERESKRRMYADIKNYMEQLQALSREVAELRKYHAED